MSASGLQIWRGNQGLLRPEMIASSAAIVKQPVGLSGNTPRT
jgi:hypothetical protein